MDERMEDHDAGDASRTAAATGDASSAAAAEKAPAAAVANNQYNPRKGMSYSQPLDRDAVLASASRRSAVRKHSLDDDRIFSSSSSSSSDAANPYYEHDSARSLSYPYPYNISAPLPPHHQAAGGSFGGSFSHDGRKIAGVSDSEGSLTLERAMSEYGGDPGTLPEFMGGGGGTGIFRVPLRAAMHPGRPPALEMRPHPLRESQAGSFLRSIACGGSQLWAGQESGLRVWNLEDVFDAWGPNAEPKRGDEESAPFRESSQTSPTLCLVIDTANGLIWSGHKDGKIRSWKMEQPKVVNSGKNGDNCFGANGSGAFQFREGLSWQAHHRSPVLCMVITSYGEIWSGSEGGIIKAWPWDAIEKSLSRTMEERHMAALLVERSYVDLRSKVSVNGVCNLPTSDVKYMASDNSRSKVWTASSLSFALWDSRTRDLLKAFGIDGVEVRVDMPLGEEQRVEDEMKTKFVSSSKKEKSQGSMNFFQRSKNALIGAADAVRRVAAKGTFVEDNKRTESLAISTDGTVWTGCTNGSLIQWDGNGNRIQELQHHASSVQCICTHGTRLWVGYASGTIQVMDLEGNVLGGWNAHSSPVIKMSVGGSYIFSLAKHGGIRGWYLSSPGPLDDILKMELANKQLSYTKHKKLKILAGTWNVGQQRASPDSLISWLGSAASEVGLVVVGLQEVEMGAGFLAMAAAKETVGLEGSANGQWWLDTIGKTLDEGTSFHRVGSRQLAGLLIAAWSRKNIRPHIGDVDAAAVPCGFGRAIGNKGAVGLRMRIYDRVISFVNCHFAAHLEAVSRRNADFYHVYRTMSFSRPTIGPRGTSGGATSVQLRRGVNVTVSQHDDGRPELSEADMIIFLGDFNYRLHGITYDEARDMVSQRCFDWLREKDQLRAEMKAGKVFQGMREGQIKFPPTYKFERHQPGLSGYDSGEKKRIPAWCDRILYRDNRSISVVECSLECPVVASIILYEACMDVTDSDHKPVRCKFNVEISHVDELVRRQEFGDVIVSNEKIRSLIGESCAVPETAVSTNNIILQNQETSILRITNNCAKNQATFQIISEGQSTIKDDESASELCARPCFGFPFWLEIHPAAGILKPGQTTEVSVRHEESYTQEEFVDGIPQNWWCEDTRDKEVVLLVNITGSGSTESKIHRVRIRHCFSSKSTPYDTKNPSGKNQSDHFHKTDVGNISSSSDSPRLMSYALPMT